MRAATIVFVLGLLFPALAGCVADDDDAAATPPGPEPASMVPLVTIAHVDTGVNPYHAIWRSDEPFALTHPSTYLPGYPADARALDLSLDVVDMDAALEADRDIWATTEPGVLYYVPGTRIVGMINVDGKLIVDDHGHGTMTASRSAGPDSLAPTARFVSVQGLGAGGVAWIAEQGWIDVQTNSWGSLVPAPSVVAFQETPDTIAVAATKMPVVFASGNGNGFNGVGPNPTLLSQTAPPGTIQVGGHDNGRITLWHGQAAHVVADYFGGPHAARDSYDAYGNDGIACCTSASAPYAAGGLAAIVLAARTILGDTTAGITDGPGGERILASGANATASGPLDDGVLTVREAIRLYLVTAQIPVREGPHDGGAHWATQGATPDPTAPAGNPYCQLCWGTPVRWQDVPSGAPAYANAGYGAIDPWSVAAAVAVLDGSSPLPGRAAEDQWFAADALVRGLLYDTA